MIYLLRIAHQDNFAALSHPSQKRFDLVPRQILSLINNNKLIRNASSPNVCQRLHLNRSDSCQNRFKFTRLFALNKNSRLSKIGCIHGLSFSSFRPANIRYPFPPGRWDARRSVFINTEILRLQKPCRESKQGFSVPAFPIRVTSGISSSAGVQAPLSAGRSSTDTPYVLIIENKSFTVSPFLSAMPTADEDPPNSSFISTN